jgi:hypothetical protein
VETPPKKKSKKGLVITLTAIVTALVMVLGIGGWCLTSSGGSETVYVRTVSRVYDSNGVVTELTKYEYDEQGRLLKYAQDWGIGEQVYNEELKLFEYISGEVDGTINVYRGFEYDDRGNLISYETRMGVDQPTTGQEYEWAYDGDQVEEMEQLAQGGFASIDTQFTYDRDGNLTEIYTVNKEGKKRYDCKMDYDSEGRLIQKIQMNYEGDQIYDFVYNEDGLVEEYIYSRGTPTYNNEYKYSSVGEWEHLYLSYTDNGALEEVATDGGEFVYWFDYDEKGRVISKEYCGSDGVDTYEFTYKGDRLVSGNCEGTEYIYDENGCLTKIRYEDGSFVEYEYEERTLSEEEVQWFHRQQQMVKVRLMGRATSVDWSYSNYEYPLAYIIPTPLDPALFTGPATE